MSVTESVTEGIKKRASQSKAMVSRYSRRSLVSESKVWLLALFCGLLVGLVMSALRGAIVGVEFIGSHEWGVDRDRI